jgi:aspartyl-tRNA synthetase
MKITVKDKEELVVTSDIQITTIRVNSKSKEIRIELYDNKTFQESNGMKNKTLVLKIDEIKNITILHNNYKIDILKYSEDFFNLLNFLEINTIAICFEMNT